MAPSPTSYLLSPDPGPLSGHAHPKFRHRFVTSAPMGGRRLFVAAAVAACIALESAAQMQMLADEEEMLEGMGIRGSPMGRKNQEPMAAPIKSDLRHIYCGVCRKM